MVLPKVTFSFVLHSFLHYFMGEDLQYVRYDFSARLEWVQEHFLHYSLLEMLPKVFELAGNEA